MNKSNTTICQHTAKDRRWSNFLLPEGANIDDMMELVPTDTAAPLPPIVINPAIFTLKKLKVHNDMSQETVCFSAEIWFNGRRVGIASNEGHGGCTSIHPSFEGIDDKSPVRESLVKRRHAMLKEAEDWASQLPPESSYQRLYETMAIAEQDTTAGPVKEQWWFSTSDVNLEHLVDAIAARKATRAGIRGLSKLVICGPKPKEPGIPVCTEYAKAITEEQLEAARAKKTHKWMVRFSDFFDLPYHYYPAPHPYAARWTQKVIYLPTQKVGKVGYRSNDDEVMIELLGPDPAGEYGEMTCKPEDLDFISNEDAAKFLEDAKPKKASRSKAKS